MLPSRLIRLALLASAVFWSHPAWANPVVLVDLQFDALPSSQGWTYLGAAEETSIWSSDGTALTMNTMGLSTTTSGYAETPIVSASLPLTLSIRARVLEIENPTSILSNAEFALFLDQERFVLGLGTDALAINWGSPLAFDNTVFHDYRAEITPGVGYELFIDDVLFASGPSPSSPIPNRLEFGDSGRGAGENAHIQISRLTLTQVPEPSTALLLAAGLAGLAGHRRRRGPVGAARPRYARSDQ